MRAAGPFCSSVTSEAEIREAALAGRLIALAGERFYPARTWPAVLAGARVAGEDPHALDALERWLPGGRVDRARSAVRERPGPGPGSGR